MDDIGDRDAPAGSRPWCQYFAFQAKKIRDEMSTEADQLRRVLGYLEEYEAWKVLGYASFGMLCAKECNLTPEQVDAVKTAKPGETIEHVLGSRPGPAPGSMTKAARDTPISGDTRNKCTPLGKRHDAAYLSARLARDRPDLKAQLDAGEFPSVRAAARAAGIVRPTATFYTDNPDDAARAIKRHFRGEQLEALIWALSEGLKT